MLLKLDIPYLSDKISDQTSYIGGSLCFTPTIVGTKQFLMLRSKQAGRDLLHQGANWNTKCYEMLGWWLGKLYRLASNTLGHSNTQNSGITE